MTWLASPGAAEILAFLLTEEPRAMPRPDPATAGKRRPIHITPASMTILEETYTLLIVQLLPIFGRNRTAEMALCTALKCETLTVRRIT